MLWVDKYRPITLQQLTFHEGLNDRLHRLVKSADFTHLLVYGPPGAGKKTRVMGLLREMYGNGVEKLRIEHRSFKTSATSSNTVELTTLSSNYHIEMNPSDVGIYDRIVVQELIKEIAQSNPLAGSFKIVVLNEVDKLSKEAQQSLRRTMEKYVSSCRLILMCNSTSKIIDPIKSRCLSVRVPAPSINEIVTVMQNVAKKENISLPTEFAERIAEASERNLRRSLLMLEASKADQYPFTANQQIQMMDWERFIIDTARLIVEEQSPARLVMIRGKFYELLANCIPPEVILRRLTLELIGKCDAVLKHDIAEWAAFYEHRLNLGSKPIFHLEAFVAKFMSLYKNFIIEQFGGF